MKSFLDTYADRKPGILMEITTIVVWSAQLPIAKVSGPPVSTHIRGQKLLFRSRGTYDPLETEIQTLRPLAY